MSIGQDCMLGRTVVSTTDFITVFNFILEYVLRNDLRRKHHQIIQKGKFIFQHANTTKEPSCIPADSQQTSTLENIWFALSTGGFGRRRSVSSFPNDVVFRKYWPNNEMDSHLVLTCPVADPGYATVIMQKIMLFLRIAGLIDFLNEKSLKVYFAKNKHQRKYDKPVVDSGYPRQESWRCLPIICLIFQAKILCFVKGV